MNSENILTIENVIEIEQPIGTFLLAKVKANELLDISFKEERVYNKELQDYVGNQRAIKEDKVKKIRNFINTPDSTFPNTIIGTLVDEYYEYSSETKTLKIYRNKSAFKIIDGQHRLAAFDGLLMAQKFDLLVTFFLNADLNDQAYIFSVINTTQSKLDPSLVHDLTELSNITTPENIVHSIAKLFNKRVDSPWQGAIKMLGKKDYTSQNGIISQYSFNKSILNYIYDKKQTSEIRNILIKNNNNRLCLKDIKYNQDKNIFWDFYVNSKEGLIYKILNTYFCSIRDVFLNKWCSNNSILCKTSGYDAFMKLFLDFYKNANGDVSKLTNENYYIPILRTIENLNIDDDANKLGAAGAAKLYKLLIDNINFN